jgi:hypothetical protein
MFNGSMRIDLFIFAFGCLAVFGCRSSVRLDATKNVDPDGYPVVGEVQRPDPISSVRLDTIKNVDPDGYLVVGEVQKPGPIASHGSRKTLLTLHTEAGGLRELAHAKKIQIIHSGVTNTVNYWPIKKGETEDPWVRLGSTVLVKRALPPF